MANTTHYFERLHTALRDAKRVLLIAHKKPDGDTTGSSSSVLNWLLREGKDVTAFCADIPPKNFRYIDNIHLYTNDPSVFDRAYDVVVVFDSGDLRYCGVDEHMPRLPLGYLLVNIDHHVTNTNFGHVNLVLTDASSTAEVIYRFYDQNNIHIDPRMATSLLTGLFTDTSNFSNAATNILTVSAAGRLLAAGARKNDILKHLLHDRTVDSLKLFGTLLSRLRRNAHYDVATTYLLRSDAEDVSPEVLDGVSNFIGAVLNDADGILFIRELPGNQVKGSFRSVNRDISRVCKLLGGGGHKKAAGFTVNGRIVETAEGPRIVA